MACFVNLSSLTLNLLILLNLLCLFNFDLAGDSVNPLEPCYQVLILDNPVEPTNDPTVIGMVVELFKLFKPFIRVPLLVAMAACS